jgi:hypothetical protein
MITDTYAGEGQRALDRLPRGHGDRCAVNDPGSVILCRMDNGAVFRIFGLACPGTATGRACTARRARWRPRAARATFGPGQVRVWHDHWLRRPGQPAERTYVPTGRSTAELANRAGHGGGDFWTNFEFANAIRSGKPPYLNVYRGVAMSSVGILAWKSALPTARPSTCRTSAGSRAARRLRTTTGRPSPAHAGPGQPPPSMLGFTKPSAKAVAGARKVWARQGYTGV